MTPEQRDAQDEYSNLMGIHNNCPAECVSCGKWITVGMKNKCPHEQTSQETIKAYT